jgi:hypothetical protein
MVDVKGEHIMAIIKSPPCFHPVVVHWEDAESTGSSEFENPASALISYRPAIRKSIGFWVGFAIKDGRECAILATDDDRREDSPQALGGTFQIPKGMVIAIEPLRLAPARKKR